MPQRWCSAAARPSLLQLTAQTQVLKAAAFAEQAGRRAATPLLLTSLLHLLALSFVPCAADGLTVAEFTVPGDEWADLEPSTQLNFSTAASGAAGGGAFAVVRVPDFQNQIPTYGSHWPIRFMPAFIAVGGSDASSSADGAGCGSAEGAGAAGGAGGGLGAGPWCTPPAAAGSLVIPYCCGDVENLVWWEEPAPVRTVQRSKAGGSAPPKAALVGDPYYAGGWVGGREAGWVDRHRAGRWWACWRAGPAHAHASRAGCCPAAACARELRTLGASCARCLDPA